MPGVTTPEVSIAFLETVPVDMSRIRLISICGGRLPQYLAKKLLVTSESAKDVDARFQSCSNVATADTVPWHPRGLSAERFAAFEWCAEDYSCSTIAELRNYSLEAAHRDFQGDEYR